MEESGYGALPLIRMDALTSVPVRKKSAEQHIHSLEKETEELRRRVQRIEMAEDRLQQDRRRSASTLLFFGPSLKSGRYRHHDDLRWNGRFLCCVST